MPPTRTCDQCYTKKKKCRRQIDLPKCVRCTHLALSCSTARHSRPPGRPARAKALGPEAEIQVWASRDRSSTLETASSQTPGDQSISPTLQRASPGSAPEQYNSGGSAHQEAQPVKLPDVLQDFGPAYHQGNVAPEPTDEEFYQLNDIFMIGPTFTKSFRRALNYSYMTAPHILRDTFSVMIRYMTTTNKPKTPVPAHAEIAGVADLLRKSQATEITSSNDALAFLVLGQSLAALDTFLVSTGSMLILRHTLYLARPWYAELAQKEFLDSVTVTPICWEILECLLKREIPIIRPLILRPQVVDRLFGACVPLMPILYDLCQVSHDLKSRSQSQSPGLLVVEQQVLSWEPDETSISTSGFSDAEMMLLRAQATIYRSATLLLIHRIKYPLGSHDGVAVSYANDIMEEKDKILLDGGPDIKLQFGCFAFFLALLEIPLRPEALWKSLTKLSYCPACAEQFFAFHRYFWQQRWDGYKGSMFDLIESGPSFMAVP